MAIILGAKVEVGAEDANTEGELEGETVVSVVGREGRSEGTIEGDEGIPLGAYVGPKVVEGRIVGGGPRLNPDGMEHCGRCKGTHC